MAKKKYTRKTCTICGRCRKKKFMLKNKEKKWVCKVCDSTGNNMVNQEDNAIEKLLVEMDSDLEFDEIELEKFSQKVIEIGKKYPDMPDVIKTYDEVPLAIKSCPSCGAEMRDMGGYFKCLNCGIFTRAGA